MIDTHAHLFLEEFNVDYKQVIENAQKAGVTAFILPNVDSTTTEALLSLHKQFNNTCFPCIGVHPTSINNNYTEEIEHVKQALESNNFIAIGEIGIDLYWDKTHLKEQQIAFEIQIELAIQHKLPIIVHTRQSFDEAFEIINKYRGKELNGVFHCFSGNIEQGQKLIDIGFKLGIGGVVTFKNSGLAETIKHFSLNDLVLETDAPYLAPSPFRGQRNEPSHLVKIAERIAEIFETTLEQVDHVTTENAKKLFNLEL